MLKNLGPRRKCEIPMEVYDDNGDVSDDTNVVLRKWCDDYEHLFNFQSAPGDFDDDFYNSCKEQLPLLEEQCASIATDGLNSVIGLSEVEAALRHAKLRKAIGIDNLPNEILKNANTVNLLHALFDAIFNTGVTPTIWKTAILKPLPKSSLVDPRLPLQYRGISLLSTVYKIYSSILNKRITKYAEENNIFADEQNGFRSGRSCQDHIYSLTTIIRNRRQQGKSTYVAFIDMEKAFDRVDRDLLFYKLIKLGIGGKIYTSIKNMYIGSKACINVNGYISDSFFTEFGVKQGDCLSPTLFGLYINDLVSDIKNTTIGVDIGLLNIHCLLYADDIAFLAETEDDLQNMLNTMHSWCHKWRMKVNASKSKVIHFRPNRTDRTNYEFHYGANVIETVCQYKYLGIVVDEFLDYSVTAGILADSAGRALGSIYTKYRFHKGLGYTTYTKLYEAGVVPILDYCAGVWGHNKLDKIDTIQNRAIRWYLGVHKFAPNKAISADMGWMSCRTRRHICMLRLWNRLVTMNPERLTRRIFEWDKQNRGWCRNIHAIMQSIHCADCFINSESINLNDAKQLLHRIECVQWERDVTNVPKLRTYVKFKYVFEKEPYVNIFNRGYRSAMAQFRCGILPLSVETGRYNCIPLEFRLCNFCDDNVVEDETHFLLHCSFYNDMRNDLLSFVRNKYMDYDGLNDNEKMVILMSGDIVLKTSEFIFRSFGKRRRTLYN